MKGREIKKKIDFVALKGYFFLESFTVPVQGH